MIDDLTTRTAVQRLYNTYPFPPDPLLDEPPPGYNWRWNWNAAYSFCTGQKPARQDIRILDAGCGTGVGTEYLILLNPQAEIVGIDLSEKALEIAQERCRRSGVAAKHQPNISFHHLNLEEADQLAGEFDLINCVGVLHHLPNPVRGIQALARKLAPGGFLHIFVYAELGRWEIQLMQKAIVLLQADKRGDYPDGVSVGRQIFASLPENNRILKREKERWSLENHRDESFADMYVHPQEIDYNVETLFALIDASGLEFIGFSNPEYWQLERLLGKSPQLIERAKNLSDRDRYRLIELLDPEITHYEFFLGKPPFVKADWSKDAALLAAIPERHPCMHGWPSPTFLNYNYQPVTLSETEFQFLQACDQEESPAKKVGEILKEVPLSLEEVRSLQHRQLIMLTEGLQPFSVK
jgi:2-polyprenyl-3-methyl-5-hydroxy-6-metoxy-1,4-benzoquinol methylase